MSAENEDIKNNQESNASASSYSEEVEDSNEGKILEVTHVEFDTKKTYKYNDRLKFQIKLTTQEDLNEDVLVKILYFGSYGDTDDEQVLGSALAGPFPAGEHMFEMETDQDIQLHKIPIKGLFGLNTVLLSFTTMGHEVVRYAFITNVEYPGVKQEDLIVEESEVNEEFEESEESGDGEDLVDVDDGEVQNECQGQVEVQNAPEENVAEAENDCKEDCCDDECGEECCETECEEECHNCPCGANSDVVVTPIEEDKDEFVWNEKTFKKSEIQFKFMDRPLVQAFPLPVDLMEEGEEFKKVKLEE